MVMNTISITHLDWQKLGAQIEGHCLDFKSLEVAPAKLTKSLSAFANADGGELFVGIREPSGGGDKTWHGFKDVEAANGHIQAIDSCFQFGQGLDLEFLACAGLEGLVLHITVLKGRQVVKTTGGDVYVRRGAQNLPIETDEARERLRLDKGITSFETATVNTPHESISNSSAIIEFMLDVVPSAEPIKWLRKQALIYEEKPTVAGIVLFADEPQALIPKHCGIKVYRYRTQADEGTRETLAGNPITVEGCAYNQIRDAMRSTKEIIESISKMTEGGLELVRYPEETLHEVITNAVIHRDYSIPDDIHIRIYDNRVEVESPGSLPGHITPQNILDERFARNGNIVRIINKFPDPPNKDVGEGLNTAFRAMRQLQLRNPEIIQHNNKVIVYIRHEKLASPEERIMEYLGEHATISNGEAREVCVIREDWRIRNIFAKMASANMIEKLPGSVTSNTAYQKKA